MHPFCVPFDRLVVTGLILLRTILPSLFEGVPKPPENREQVGTALGKPIYRDQIEMGPDQGRNAVLRLFIRPVMAKYRTEHRKQVEPTQAELDFTTAYFNKVFEEELRAKRPELERKLAAIQQKLRDKGLSDEQRKNLEVDREIVLGDLNRRADLLARFLLNNWKFQRHLYDNFGGGRILWQQAGQEAFDAMHNWLKKHEEKGDFKVTDPEVRALLYEYWTAPHGPFLTSDKEAIRKEFLEPEWAPKLTGKQ